MLLNSGVGTACGCLINCCIGDGCNGACDAFILSYIPKPRLAAGNGLDVIEFNAPVPNELIKLGVDETIRPGNCDDVIIPAPLRPPPKIDGAAAAGNATSSLSGAFPTIVQDLQTKVPVVWVIDVVNTWNSNATSTSGQFPAYGFDLAAAGIASNSPEWGTVLPSSFTYLSTTTIMQYMSPDVYDFLMGLEAAAFYFAGLWIFYEEARWFFKSKV